MVLPKAPGVHLCQFIISTANTHQEFWYICCWKLSKGYACCAILHSYISSCPDSVWSLSTIFFLAGTTPGKKLCRNAQNDSDTKRFRLEDKQTDGNLPSISASSSSLNFCCVVLPISAKANPLTLPSSGSRAIEIDETMPQPSPFSACSSPSSVDLLQIPPRKS